ncbi:OmpA family protein [Aurantibacillus circumpalustris]|uniref:OmpA family protein n=1 Tax=Aurantibacillus circumpalustris TaxID=3036359 RepID=UPI00295B288C|nr:OmpA family protein [Aurantibacillus circumpalustris]
MKRISFCFVLIFIVGHLPFAAQTTEKEYSNGHGGKIKLPLGDISFADKMVSYKTGTPAPIPENRNPNDGIGKPDFNEMRVSGFVSLGTGGELILAFTDNALVNIEGPDLYVFEVGRYVEETFLYVSKNGKTWINVGKISGGNALIEIGDSTKPGDIFTYVKLVDAGTTSKKGDHMWPGADIDAVAAIGSAKQLSLNSLYLFNTNEAKIKTTAKKELDEIINELKANPLFNLVINGHTDSTGNKKLNQKLSVDRAEAIRNYFVTKLPELKNKITTNGYADEMPVSTNLTDEGREKNRRVEVFFIPIKK